ncbi:unnamed protein product [Heligmosomoides polygyrus]|uniref:Protein RFT1 homolog n=1 Tax=Heligmosomoides polygyrus TaxID=6339 RepID=A0A183G8V3_HELPZ|nr:unnamed protein product [Heligmosomoides polygyrus]
MEWTMLGVGTTLGTSSKFEDQRRCRIDPAKIRLSLLYNTILFLTREPMRKANILRTSLPCFVNVVWLSPIISAALSVLCTAFWITFSSSHDVPLRVVLAFPLSAVIESLAEPFAVISLRVWINLDKSGRLAMISLDDGVSAGSASICTVNSNGEDETTKVKRLQLKLVDGISITLDGIANESGGICFISSFS